MDTTNLSNSQSAPDKKNSQTVIIDGCKVTINYAETSAIGILSNIKKNLIAQQVTQK